MADIKISALPSVATATLADVFPIVQGGVTYKESLTQVQSLFNITSSSTLQLARLGLGSAVVASAILSLSSTALGFLPPVMTTLQRNAISSPATGLIVYNSTTSDLEIYNGSSWSGATTGGVSSGQGTPNQVLVNGTSGSPTTGALIFSTPQDIGTASAVQFGSIGIGVAPSTAGRLQASSMCKFGSANAFNTVAGHEFVFPAVTGNFINIWSTGTISLVSAGGNATGIQSQHTFNNSAGTQQIIEAFTAFPTFSLTSNLPQANGYRSLMTFGSGSGLTVTAASNFRSAAVSAGGFTGTVTNIYGFYGEALNIGTNRYGSYILAPTGGTIAIASYADNASIGYNVTPPNNGLIVSGIAGFGTSAVISDVALPVQLNAANSTERYFAVNKAGTYGALFGFLNGAGLGTGVAIRSITTDPIYMFVNNTVPALFINSSAQFGFNTTTLTSNFRNTFNIATTDLVAINVQGAMTPSSGTPVGLRMVLSLSPPSVADSAYLNQLVPTFSVPSGGGNWCGSTYTSASLILTGNLSQYFGHRLDAPVKSGAGTCNYAWQIYAEAPNFATNNITAYFAPKVGVGTNVPLNSFDVNGNMAIGTYAGVNTAPSNGLLVSGQTIFKATSSFVSASVEIQGADRVSFGIGGTKTSTDGVTQASMYLGATYAPTVNTIAVAQILSYPQFNPPTGVTIATAYNFHLQSGGQAGLGSVTTGINLYVENPGFGTTKIATWINGATTINTGIIDGTSQLTVNGGISNFARSDGFGVISINETANAGVEFLRTSNASSINSSGIQMIHTRGTYASPTATQNNDILGFIDFGGYTNTVYAPGIALIASASQTWTSTAAGSNLDVYVTNDSTTSNSFAFRWSSNGNVVCGGNNGAALATNANNGFFYIPSCAGTPTGTPTTYTGRNAIVYDTSANKLWVYNGSWRGVAVT